MSAKVRDVINAAFWTSPVRGPDPRQGSTIDEEVLDIPADSTVGRGVVKLCKAAEEIVSMLDDEDCPIERDLYYGVIEGVCDQVAVWYYG